MGNPKKGYQREGFLKDWVNFAGEQGALERSGARKAFSRNLRAPGVVAWCLGASRKENALGGHHGLRSSGIWRF